ncbi:hypothetical protein [Mesomycoplasma ovipneumoniae]|uniref:hypothetical protein n=1 Tax=Mesomycoplasma ovipneumoniae TaxID=29562 RepID=UPI000A81BE53|nr:hypothetical protein [Mesomycoplasma ovipneumoniae]
MANFTIRDPLAGRDIAQGGFEGRDVKVNLQKLVDSKGTDLSTQTGQNVEKQAKIQNSKVSFELENLEKNAIYKLISLTWADIEETQQTISGFVATQYQVDPTTKTTPTTNQKFSDFAIKVSDPGTNSKIEGSVSGNGSIEFGNQFIIKPESAKIVKIEIDDKKVDSATITLTFDNSDKYLKHADYQDKLELVYYQTGSIDEKTAPLSLDNATADEVKFKAELTSLEKGTGFRVLGIRQKGSSGGGSRRRRSTTSSPNLNFVFDSKLTEDTKKFATLPIVNSILQFRNDRNPEDYDFLLSLKDTGEVFKQIQASQSKSIKAKIQYKKVVQGNEAKETIQEVIATLGSAQGQEKESNDSTEQNTTFKFTLTSLESFAQYYITKIAYDTNDQLSDVLTSKTEDDGDENSGLFNFSPQAEEKRAFLTYPAKVEVKSIEIQPDFSQNNAKLTIKFDEKYKAFLDTYNKLKVNYTSPKGLGQSVEIDKDNFNSTRDTNSQEPSVEVTINNINEPGKYVVESLEFADEKSTSTLLSSLELPPVEIKESVTIAKRSFYTNTKVVAIRKKAISETSATIELVIEDPNGSFIGKKVKGTFTYQANQASQTKEESGTIIADEIEKTSKVVFQLKGLSKNTDYSITSLVFDQSQTPQGQNAGGDTSQFNNQQNIEFNDEQIKINANADSSQSQEVAEIKQFKTTFESATALGITYQLDQTQDGKPWQKAKVRVFFSSQDKPLEEKSTRLKLVYKSSKQGISKESEAFVNAKLLSIQTQQGQPQQNWLNNQPDEAHYYYEFDLDNLDAGAQYTIIGLEDEAEKIKIIVPDPNAPIAVNFSSQATANSSFSFNTAPLITKMTYVPGEKSIKLILAVENSQKLDFSNHRATIKYKKLENETNKYGWQDPTNKASGNDLSDTADTITVRVPQRQQDPTNQASQQQNEENFGITFLEFELGGLEKGSWYLIEEISLSTRGANPTPLSLYLDKEKMEPVDKKTETSESEKWQTIVNTTIESTTIKSATTSTTNGSNITVDGQPKNTPQLTSGHFQIDLDSADLVFLKDKYNIQLELESVEKKIFYTESKEITDTNTSAGAGKNTQIILEAKGLIPGDKYTIKNYIFNLKEGDQENFAVRLPQKLKVTPPTNNADINLKTQNAIKAIKYEAVSEGTTNIDVEFYNNNGELNNKELELSAEIDKDFGNKYLPTSWGDTDKKVTSSKTLTPIDGQIVSTLKFEITSGLKKAKQYIIKSIKQKDATSADGGGQGSSSGAGTEITFDTPISQESALQRKFYSKAEKTKLINTTISDVTTDSATITLEFDKDDAFLKDDLVTLYLEKGDKSQSIGATTLITNSGSSSGGAAGTGSNQDKLHATFKFLNILEPGIKYKINALTSKTVDLKVDDTSKVTDPNLTQGWKFTSTSTTSASTSSPTTTSTTSTSIGQVILDFITQPLITNIIKETIEDDHAKIKLEGWTQDLQDAGFNPKFTVTKKQSTQQPQQPQPQPAGSGVGTDNDIKEGRKEQSSPPENNSITFKVNGLEQFTEYNNITLTLEKNGAGGGGVSPNTNQLSQDFTVPFAPEIASGAKQSLREFRTTAKTLNLAASNPVSLEPISTSAVNISIKLKDDKQANSVADVPFVLRYKKIFPTYEADVLESTTNPVLINVPEQKFTFNVLNLEPGAIYEVQGVEPFYKDKHPKDNHNIVDLKPHEKLLKYLKDVESLPIKSKTQGSNPEKIYFSPLNVPVKLERAWSHPLRYDYYEGEQVYIKFNKEAGTAITLDWLKQNLKLELIPHRTHIGRVTTGQENVEKKLSEAGSYHEKTKGEFNTDVTLSNLKWDPEKTTATLKVQPRSLKSIVAATIKITIKDVNNYHLDPTKELATPAAATATTSASPASPTSPTSPTPDNSQSISFRLQSSAVMVTPTNVDYMNPGLIGFSYAIYDPLDLIQKTGKDYNPFGEFPHLTPYKEQDWLKVIINKQFNTTKSEAQLQVPDKTIFDKIKGKKEAAKSWENPTVLDIPEEPVAIRTKTDNKYNIKYLTLYWRINSNTGTFEIPEKFRDAKKLWYPAGKLVHLPISLQFKNDSLSSLSSSYSFVLNSPYANPGHIMPYASTANPHDADSIIAPGVNYWQLWNQGWTKHRDTSQLIPRINLFEKHISKVFWSAPSFEWTTNDRDLNTFFYLNRKVPVFTDYDKTRNYKIDTGQRGTTDFRNGKTWDILYVKNRENHVKIPPELVHTQMKWDYWWQTNSAEHLENKRHKSSWIISITNPQGKPLLYDPINYYAMLGPFEPPELPE